MQHIRKIYTVKGCLIIALALMFATSCKDEPEQETGTTPVDTATAPTPIISYSLVNQYPHDPTAFTEGLEYVDGYLYESVGRYGQSDIRKTDLKTGKVVQKQINDAQYFGEGLTVMNGKIYQLTYQERKGFVYDQKTMKLLQTFNLPTAEGWGMTHDSTHLIYGDGTDKLYYLDPATLKLVKTVAVTDAYGPVTRINELEYINGYIYANQWETDYILKIDPASGKVVGQANLGSLRQQTNIPPPVPGDETAPEYLNGIAYDAQNNRIFITGKNWPKLFEIKLDN